MDFSVSRTYWAVLILANIAYLILNNDAYQRTRKWYMLAMTIVSMTIVATTMLGFLIRYSVMFYGHKGAIQNLLLAIPIVRMPLDVWLYYKLLGDFKKAHQSTIADHISDS